LVVGRLLPYKKVDLVIQAFAELGFPLVIAGTGPELAKLKVQSHKLRVNASFREFVRSDVELRDLYRGARALIFPQVEDFGLVAVEAIACGTPVVAFRAGGACEIVREGETGIFFDEQTPAAIAAAVRKLGVMRFDRRLVAKGAEQFSRDAFRAGIIEHLPLHLRP
jgi:glycosyltransferase involved in cell wall biosynthesis